MRLNLPGHGSVSLNYDWSERGATQALPLHPADLQALDGWRITLAAAATNTNTSRQKLDSSQLIETYREFVPNAGDKTWEGFYLPVLRNCASNSRNDPHWKVKRFAWQPSRNGNREQGCVRRAVRGSMAS